MTIIWFQEWKSTTFFGMERNIGAQWEDYVMRMKRTHVKIKEEVYTLVWTKTPTLGFYKPKLAYNAMFGEEKLENIQWWWKSLWKNRPPMKEKNTML